ncbi:MAG: Peptidyl-prolyl isomerase cwc27 [Bathelium mastoideum]|nr:MAG: Peptidyl-prolyl isomerase cwc27 [Bathelium mastoideum]
MSALYNLEPQPTAKVVLTTTAGDLVLELFAKQTPLASRNFLQLCLDGYYDGTVFHRLVSGFIIQGGDPTGTGAGGESSYDGEPFADEFHSRLKFNRRGLLGMANTGKKDDNGSQFFLTLDKTEELQGKNTMFGRVAGDTIYNLMKMGEAELAEQGGDRPLYPTKITGAEVLVNPFEDMAKRVQMAQRTAERTEKKKPKKKTAKNMLSFGGDDEDGIDAEPAAKKPKFNAKFVSGNGEDGVKINKAAAAARPATKPARRRTSPSPPLKASTEPPVLVPSKATTKTTTPVLNHSSRFPSISSSSEPEQVSSMSNLLSKTNAQIAELKASMQRNVRGPAEQKAKPRSALEAMVPVNSIRGRKRKHGGGIANGATSFREERQALSAFNAFKEKLDGPSLQGPLIKTSQGKDGGFKDTNGATKSSAPENSINKTAVNDEDADLCDLHFIANCQSCSKWNDSSTLADEEDFAKGGAKWMNHSLSFAKDRLGKDLEWKRKNEEELVVIDPREKEKSFKEGKRQKDRGSGAWERSAGRGADRERTNK